MFFSNIINVVGEDTFKNRFFEDKSKSFGRHRWVDYIDGSTPDSSKITPEWHAWLHHNIDALPSKHPLPEPAYKIPATGNRTGTRDAYVPSHHRLNSNFHGRANEKYESWKQPTPTTGTGSGSKAKESDVDVLDLK